MRMSCLKAIAAVCVATFLSIPIEGATSGQLPEDNELGSSPATTQIGAEDVPKGAEGGQVDGAQGVAEAGGEKSESGPGNLLESEVANAARAHALPADF